MSTRSLLALASLSIAITACGGSDGPTGNDGNGNPPGGGSFSANVTGAITLSLTGDAVFGASAINDGFGLLMGNTNDGIILGRDMAGVPGNGNYPIYDLDNGDEEEAPAASMSGVIAFNSGGQATLCYTRGGTLTVNSSSATRLKGSFTIQAGCYQAGSETAKVVTISGTFDAVGATAD